MTSRRQFLAACAVTPWISPAVVAAEIQPSTAERPSSMRGPFVTFDEPGFPAIGGVAGGAAVRSGVAARRCRSRRR